MWHCKLHINDCMYYSHEYVIKQFLMITWLSSSDKWNSNPCRSLNNRNNTEYCIIPIIAKKTAINSLKQLTVTVHGLILGRAYYWKDIYVWDLGALFLRGRIIGILQYHKFWSLLFYHFMFADQTLPFNLPVLAKIPRSDALEAKGHSRWHYYCRRWSPW